MILVINSHARHVHRGRRVTTSNDRGWQFTWLQVQVLLRPKRPSTSALFFLSAPSPSPSSSSSWLTNKKILLNQHHHSSTRSWCIIIINNNNDHHQAKIIVRQSTSSSAGGRVVNYGTAAQDHRHFVRAQLSSFFISLSLSLIIIISDHHLCAKMKKIQFLLISRWRDSNSRPSPYKGDALTTVLQRLHLMPPCRADHLAQLKWTSDFVSRGCGFTFYPICVKRNCQNFISITKCPCGQWTRRRSPTPKIVDSSPITDRERVELSSSDTLLCHDWLFTTFIQTIDEWKGSFLLFVSLSSWPSFCVMVSQKKYCSINTLMMHHHHRGRAKKILFNQHHHHRAQGGIDPLGG